MADVTDTYYAGEAVTGYGAQPLVGQNDDPETFAAVADVNVITPGDMTTEVVDKTHLRSPEAHREKIVDDPRIPARSPSKATGGRPTGPSPTPAATASPPAAWSPCGARAPSGTSRSSCRSASRARPSRCRA